MRRRPSKERKIRLFLAAAAAAAAAAFELI